MFEIMNKQYDFFELKRDFNTNHNSYVILVKKGEGIDDLHLLENGLEKEKSIQLFLINNIDDKEFRKETSFDLDIIYWTDDLTLSAFMPNGTYMIVSKKLLKIILKFNLPEYLIYSINIVNLEDKTENQDYVILSLKSKLINNVDYYKSSFKLLDDDKKIKKVFKAGSFNNFENFKKRRSSYLFQDKGFLTFEKVVVKNHFDICWGVTNSFRISKRLKQSIEAERLKGIKLVPFKDFEVIMPFEN